MMMMMMTTTTTTTTGRNIVKYKLQAETVSQFFVMDLKMPDVEHVYNE
jgi:3-deoxy-D-manno-octulosonic-acid transferase